MESPILEIRKSLSMSQSQLALALGICRSRISEAERGLCSLSQREIQAFARLKFDTKNLVELQSKFVEYNRSKIQQCLDKKMVNFSGCSA